MKLGPLFPMGFTGDPGFPVPPGAPFLHFSAQDTDLVLSTTRVDAATFTPWKNGGSLTNEDPAQPTAGLRPTYRLIGDAGKLNNLSVVDFDGLDCLTTGATFGNVAQPINYGIVFRADVVVGAQVIFAGDTDGVNSHQIWLNEDKLALYAGTHVTDVGLSAVVAGQWNLVTITVNGASSIVRKNGVQSSAINVNTNPLGAALLMGKGGDAFPVNGCLAHLAAWNDGTTLAQIEAWLTAGYGAFPQ